MSTSSVIALNLPALHPGQAQIVNEAKRFNVLACGRRFGKSKLAENKIVLAALQGLPVGLFFPSYKLLGESLRQLVEVLKPVIVDYNKQDRRIEIKGGGVIEAWSLDTPDAARGRSFGLVVIDEAALVNELEVAWQQAIRPTLTDLIGEAWFLSTPKGINNYFGTLFRRGLDPEYPEWASWQMPTTANPLIDPDEVQSARADLSEMAFNQEYLGSFISWSGAVFRHILPAIWEVPDILKTPSLMRAWTRPRFCIGVDWGRTGDATVFTVACSEADAPAVPDEQGRLTNPVGILEIDRFKNMEYAFQRSRLWTLYERYGRPMVLAESNSLGGPLLEQLAKDGMRVRGFTTTNSTKAALIEDLVLAFDRGTIRIPNDTQLIAELSAFEASTLPNSGLTRYSAPDGEHDDCVISLSLAYRCLSKLSHFYDPASRAAADTVVRRMTGG